jgi:hypothetical protein
MQEIFDKKAILKNEKGQVNFDLFHEISSNLGGDLTDTFFIFKQNPKTALNLNRKDGFLTDILNKMDIDRFKLFDQLKNAYNKANETDKREIDKLIELVIYSPNPEIFKHDLEKYIKIGCKGVN